MIWIALTGRIGSGKSTAAAYFQSRGIPVIDADRMNHTLMQQNGAAYQPLIVKFGSSILCDDGTINRAQLRQCMLQNPDSKTWLESLLHPMVRQQITEQIKQYNAYPYGIIEIPLLIQKKDYPFVQRMLYIDAPIHLQRARVAQRSQWTAEEIDALIALQASRKAYEKEADDIIVNKGTLAALEASIERLHAKYLNMADHH